MFTLEDPWPFGNGVLRLDLTSLCHSTKRGLIHFDMGCCLGEVHPPFRLLTFRAVLGDSTLAA